MVRTRPPSTFIERPTPVRRSETKVAAPYANPVRPNCAAPRVRPPRYNNAPELRSHAWRNPLPHSRSGGAPNASALLGAATSAVRPLAAGGVNSSYGLTRYLHGSMTPAPFRASRYGAAHFEPTTTTTAAATAWLDDDGVASAASGGYGNGSGVAANRSEAETLHFVVHANFTALHAAPAFTSIVYESLLRWAYDGGATITVRSHPLPQTSRQLSVSAGVNGLLVCMFITIAFAFVPASFVLFVVRERETKVRPR